MIVKKTILLPVLVLGIIVLNYINSRALTFNHDLAEIALYTHFPENINIEEEDFEDLAFLDEILKEKSIVLLGEQIRNAGSTFKAKGRCKTSA